MGLACSLRVCHGKGKSKNPDFDTLYQGLGSFLSKGYKKIFMVFWCMEQCIELSEGE